MGGGSGRGIGPMAGALGTTEVLALLEARRPDVLRETARFFRDLPIFRLLDETPFVRLWLVLPRPEDSRESRSRSMSSSLKSSIRIILKRSPWDGPG